jgi:antitoxin component YwqK of YwqJK toxin-antitoxin module
MKYIPIIIFLFSLSALSGISHAQEGLNKLDESGQKQGHWIVSYDNGNPKYDGFFLDGSPIGEFKRFYENGNISVIMDYIQGTDSVYAKFYHQNKFKSSEGYYIKQLKEGEWRYYSEYIENYMVCKEEYSLNLKEGKSVKYHWNGKLAEEVKYISDRREGVWIQYYSDGVMALRAYYEGGKLNGNFEAYTLDGKPMINGIYREDIRTGEWAFFDTDGVLENKLVYRNGIPENNLEIIKSATDLLDELEKRGGVIDDPAKTGIKW